MSARLIRLAPILVFTVIGDTSGQESTPPKKKPVPEILQKAMREAIRLDLKGKKIVLGPRLIRPRFQIRPWNRVAPAPVNRLMTGEYAAAWNTFDKSRAKIYTSRDSRAARRILDEMDRELMCVRRALFELEKTAKAAKAKANVITLQVGRGLLVTRSAFLRHRLIATRNWANVTGHIWIGNRLVAHNGTNKFLAGDYRKAVDALHSSRTQISGISNPSAARKVLDKMTRQLLDVRRALWTRERAKKKKRHH
jgi:hypothetical protein